MFYNVALNSYLILITVSCTWADVGLASARSRREQFSESRECCGLGQRPPQRSEGCTDTNHVNFFHSQDSCNIDQLGSPSYMALFTCPQTITVITSKKMDPDQLNKYYGDEKLQIPQNL